MRNVAKPKEPPKLSSKHATWIVDWALEACAQHIERVEDQIVRHTALLDEPVCSKWPLECRKSRRQIIAELRDFLREYRDVHGVLLLLRDVASERNMQEFAQEMREYFRSRS